MCGAVSAAAAAHQWPYRIPVAVARRRFVAKEFLSIVIILLH